MATIMKILDDKFGNAGKSMTIMDALDKGLKNDSVSTNIMKALKKAELAGNPLSKLAIDFEIDPDYDLLGKKVGDLQEDVAFKDEFNVLGTLHYVSDYTGFSGNPDEQHGHYVAFHVSVGDLVLGTDCNVTFNGVTVDPSDGICIMIFNPDKVDAKAKLVATADGYESFTKVFHFSGMTKELAEEAEEG